MAHAYTPGLKVLKETIVDKSRRLPLKGKVLVKAGMDVNPADVVASTSLPGNVQMVNVANLLNVEPADVREMMIKTEGDSVEKDEPIAQNKGIFGLFKSVVKSPVGGTIENISTTTGQVVIREAPIPVEIDAYVRGSVKETIPEEGVVITTRAAFVQGIFGIGGEKQGILDIAVSAPDEPLTTDKISPGFKDKIILGGSFLPLDAFIKAQEVGVKGIIVGGFNYSDLKPILGYDLGVAITGTEPLTTTLVVTEGFGNIPMAKRTFELISGFKGREASINGATQIRAGVIRPEVIIPLDKTESSVKEQKVEIGRGMEIGSLVRVIRAPYFGLIGEIAELPSDLEKMESETLVRVARVKLNNGETHTIPRANLELVEI